MKRILGWAIWASGVAFGAEVRVGIIGTDTSHVVAFTKLLNDSQAKDHVAGARVVAAYESFSPDIASSKDRNGGYVRELKDKWGVAIVPRIADLCGKVDALLLESVDGRRHLPEFREAAKCGKPVFIDKPLASTFADVREIARVAKEAGVPWFTSSALRYGALVDSVRRPSPAGVVTWGPGPEEKTQALDLSWYAVHPVEMLFALMGPGCVEAWRVVGATSDEVTCKWKDGRLGSVRTLRPEGEYGAVVFAGKEVVQSPPKTPFSYVPLVREIVKFFETRTPPVPNEESVEIFAFMDAAQRSKAAGGAPVKLAK